MRRMRSSITQILFIAILFLFLIVFCGCLTEFDENDNDDSYQVMVTKVIDGDTISIRFSNGSQAKIRLLGIDCPETTIEKNHINEYQNINNLSCLTFYGLQAKTFVSDLINNSEVTIIFDDDLERKDEYGRYLCYITIDGIAVNEQLLSKGYARVFTAESFSKKSFYLEIQQDAINGSKGLWDCQLASSDIIISQVHYNAMGNDEENLNDEYIVIANTKIKTIDLSGFSIRDEHGNQFDFPAGFKIQANTSVTIYTGVGTNLSTALYWHHNTPVWNNDGDTVYLYDSKQMIIESYSY